MIILTKLSGERFALNPDLVADASTPARHRRDPGRRHQVPRRRVASTSSSSAMLDLPGAVVSGAQETVSCTWCRLRRRRRTEPRPSDRPRRRRAAAPREPLMDPGNPRSASSLAFVRRLRLDDHGGRQPGGALPAAAAAARLRRHHRRRRWPAACSRTPRAPSAALKNALHWQGRSTADELVASRRQAGRARPPRGPAGAGGRRQGRSTTLPAQGAAASPSTAPTPRSCARSSRPRSHAKQAADKHAAKFFADMGGYAPTIGIIGTVIGLVHVLENLAEPDKLGHLIAGAFVATLWGVLTRQRDLAARRQPAQAASASSRPADGAGRRGRPGRSRPAPTRGSSQQQLRLACCRRRREPQKKAA